MVKWIVVLVFLGIAGLSYVHFKNQQHSTGSEIKTLERQLAELTTQNDMVRTRISRLSSRAYLQRRISEGFVHMTPITDDRIVRIATEPSQPPVAEVRAVTNHLVAK
jgi:hypothetical protein